MHNITYLGHDYSSYLSTLNWEIETTWSSLSCREHANSSANQARLARTRTRAWSVNGPCRGSNVSGSNSGVSEKSTSTGGTYEISILIRRVKRTFSNIDLQVYHSFSLQFSNYCDQFLHFHTISDSDQIEQIAEPFKITRIWFAVNIIWICSYAYHLLTFSLKGEYSLIT